MVSLELQCVSVSSIVAECILRQEHWRAFGYRRRPRRGKLFDVFVGSNKLRQERVLIRELWAAALGRVFYWALQNKAFDHRVHFVARLINLCIDGIDEEPLWPTFRFLTPDDALDFLEQACCDYGSCGEDSDFSKVFLQRCIACLHTQPSSTWIFGAAWLFSSPNSLFMSIIPALDNTVAQNQDSDINIDGSRYYEVAEMTFRRLESV